MLIDAYRLPVLKALEREEKAAPRRPSQANYRAATRKVQSAIGGLVDRLANGEITLGTFEHDALLIIEDGHISAGALGRMRAGDLTPRNLSDFVWSLAPMREDTPRFRTFVSQIRAEDPRYVKDGQMRADSIKNRAGLYVQKMRGTANAAFEQASPDESLFDWVMLAAEHCPDCPRRQEGSPYTKHTIPSHPGDGNTACNVNCGCVLVRYSMTDSFAPSVGFARTQDPTPSADPLTMPDLTAPPASADPNDWFAV
jgi:hypothetical protein